MLLLSSSRVFIWTLKSPGNCQSRQLHQILSDLLVVGLGRIYLSVDAHVLLACSWVVQGRCNEVGSFFLESLK